MKKPKRLLLAFCLAAVVSIGVYILAAAIQEFKRGEAGMRAELEAHVRLLAEHAELSFRGVDILMAGLSASFRRNPQSLPDADMVARLQQALDYAPQLASLAVFDASGTELIWLGESSSQALNLDGAEFLDSFEQGELRQLGGLVVDSESGREFIPMGFRIGSADGEPHGGILALVDVAYFHYFHKQLDPESTIRVGMYRRGGGILSLSNTLRDQIPDPSDLQKIVALLPISSYVGPSPLDGTMRITAYRRLNDYPISMTVSEDYWTFVSDYYRSWAWRAFFFLLGVAGAWICYKAVSRSMTAAEQLQKKHMQMLQQQRHLERISREIIHHIPNGRVALLNRELHYLFADGGAFSKHERLAPAKVLGKTIRDVHRPEVASRLERLIEEVLATEQTLADMVQCEGIYFEVTAVPLRDDKQVDRILLLSHDITNFHRTKQSLEARNQELREISVTDALLGIRNRRGLDDELEREWARAQRRGEPLSLLMIDVDHFKIFNDTYGHTAGDNCLRQVAAAIGEAVYRPGDIVARYGGEEIAVLLPATDRAGALEVAERIHQALKQAAIPFPHSPIGSSVTLSIGVASVVPSEIETADSLLQLADMALYQAKQAGRNRTYFHELEAQS